jgi:pimeloyl-ACP methyl ester carboxylesterase
MEQLAEHLARTVAILLAETGAEKVHLVGHSLGGVLIAQAFADGRLTEQVDAVVTIAAPFGGSPWANLLPVGAIVRALRRGSPQLNHLALAPVPTGVHWLAITADQDRIVPGRRSMPQHAPVETVTIEGVGHKGLHVNPQVITHVLSTVLAEPRSSQGAMESEAPLAWAG